MERFLYRLSQSVHAQRFILKGALMLRVWQAPEFRPTMDIDMLGKTSNDEANIISQIREVLDVEVEPDGLAFDTNSIQSERITEDADYQGIRIRFRGTLDSARIKMQLDIGFGDIVHPSPEESELPTMLPDFAAPRLLCYSREVRSHKSLVILSGGASAPIKNKHHRRLCAFILGGHSYIEGVYSYQCRGL